MRNNKPVIFKRSLLAAAIVSLSACSTVPSMDDYDLSKVGDGIMKAGRTTVDASGRAWDKASYLLGFSDGETRNDDGTLMDEVDLAMADDDALLQDNTDVAELEISPVAVPQAVASEPLEMLEDTSVALNDPAAAQLEALIDDSAAPFVAMEDLIHEVASDETLWDISKKTTGDANNWHILADVNNLPPNASVYPGQQLIIPSDMVKPDFFGTPAADVQQAQATVASDTAIDTQQIAAVALPVADELAEPALASAEDAAPRERLAIPTLDASELNVAAVAVDDTAVKLAAGETLWDFAKRTTGDATNWQAIATHNDFTEKQAVVVRAGQSISVPDALMKPDFDAAAIPAPVVAPAAPVVTDAADAINSVDENAVEASSELLAEASMLDETQLNDAEVAPMTIVEAAFKTDPSLLPRTIETTFNESGNMTLQEVAHGEIMVSGTYYPKAIYNDADFSSSLLMRVSPGTTLQVSKAMGNWFEVATDKGVGYVHQRDIK